VDTFTLFLHSHLSLLLHCYIYHCSAFLARFGVLVFLQWVGLRCCSTFHVLGSHFGGVVFGAIASSLHSCFSFWFLGFHDRRASSTHYEKLYGKYPVLMVGWFGGLVRWVWRACTFETRWERGWGGSGMCSIWGLGTGCFCCAGCLSGLWLRGEWKKHAWVFFFHTDYRLWAVVQKIWRNRIWRRELERKGKIQSGEAK